MWVALTGQDATALGIPNRKTCRCRAKWCAHHQHIRAMWKPYVLAGLVSCWRCGELLPPSNGFDLGHDDDDIAIYRGPEHIDCNRRTATRRKARANRWVL
jgi:hypothetical protein